MIVNRSFKDFKFRHRSKKNQIIYTSKKVKNDDEALNLIDNFLEDKNSLLKSYDLFLNNKYQVQLNQKTIDRVKNYFK